MYELCELETHMELSSLTSVICASLSKDFLSTDSITRDSKGNVTLGFLRHLMALTYVHTNLKHYIAQAGLELSILQVGSVHVY